MNLKKKLTIIFSILAIMILLISSAVGYIFAKRQVIDGIQSELTATANAHVNQLDGWLISKAKMLEMVAGTIQSSYGNADINVPMLAGYKTVDNELSDVYFGTEDGKLVDGSGWMPPADFDPRTRDWYKSASQQGKLIFSDPYLDKMTNKMAVSVGMPFKNAAGQMRGVIAEDILLETLIDNVKKINLHGEGYAYLFDAKGLLLAHPNSELVNKNIFEEESLKPLSGTFKEMMEQNQGVTSYKENGVNMMAVFQKVPSTGWTLAIVVPEQIVLKPLARLGMIMILVAILAVFVVIGVTFMTVKRITSPIENLAKQVHQVAQGDLTVKAEIDGQDEIAKLAAGFNEMVQNLRSLIVHVQNSAEHVAASSEQLTANAEQSSKAASQVSASITEVSNGASEQLTAASETSAVVDQLSAEIQQVAANTNQVAEQSVQAAEKAKEGDKTVEKAVSQMAFIEKTVNTSAEVVAKLGDRSKEIGQIVDTISGIAGQTNLLALNAAIEAARAGEQGRGFAVVAEEVRKLAEQSQDAAKQIAKLIEEIQGDTDKAVVAMNEGTREVRTGAEVVNVAGHAFQEIVGLVSQVSSQVREISAAIQQMAGGSQQIVGSVRKIDSLSKTSVGEAQTVSAATEEQLASTEEIASSSEALSKLAQDLQASVAKFRV